jgi:AcrR family transcriptional regulator
MPVTAVSISAIAEAADVSRQLVYQHFRDRDALLLHAALDLARTEMLPVLADDRLELLDRERFLACVRHFAAHRTFYRAMFSGGTAMSLHRGLVDMLSPLFLQAVRRTYGGELDAQLVADLSAFITGGSGTLILEWITDGPDGHDPEALYDRLLRTMASLAHRPPLPRKSQEDPS